MAHDPYDLDAHPRISDLDRKLRAGEISGVSQDDIAGYLKVRDVLYPEAGKKYTAMLCICFVASESDSESDNQSDRFKNMGG